MLSFQYSVAEIEKHKGKDISIPEKGYGKGSTTWLANKRMVHL